MFEVSTLRTLYYIHTNTSIIRLYTNSSKMSTVEWVKINGKWVEKSVAVEDENTSSNDLLLDILATASSTNMCATNDCLKSLVVQTKPTEVILDDDSIFSDVSERSYLSSATESLSSNGSWNENMENRLRFIQNILIWSFTYSIFERFVQDHGGWIKWHP